MKLFRILLVIGLATLSTISSFAQSEPERYVNIDGIEEANKVQIYPNPTVDFLNIKVHNSKLKAPRIEVFNIIGNSVEVSIDQLEDDKFQIDVRNLPAGYYLITIKDEDVLLKDMFKFLKR